jgi:DNA repair protein RecO (recombination protein O)
MPLYRDEAIVLRTQKLGEADRIVTLLTRTLGKVRVVGKGVRRTKSRFGARLEPAMMIDVQCYEGRNLDTVTQAETLAPWGDAIARDYTTYTASTAMLETCDRLTEEREPALQQYLLLQGALRSLAGGEHEPALVLDAYLLRSLSVAGWAPSFHDCVRCGAPGPHRAFNLASGGTVCPVCRPPGSAAPAPETLRLLAALLAGDWAVADASDARHRREGSGLTAAFLQWHLERAVRSLRLVERLEIGPADARVTG